MTPLLATLEFTDYAIIAFIVVVFASGAAYAKGPDVNAQLLALQLRELQRKLDALLKHQGIELPAPPASACHGKWNCWPALPTPRSRPSNVTGRKIPAPACARQRKRLKLSTKADNESKVAMTA
jgi:hypothetical protein